MATILSIGELVWDRMPDGDHLGGAPANVAHHLTQAGHRALLVSAVGDDPPGHRALETLEQQGIDVSLVAIDPRHPTGVVEVELDARGVPTFEITRDVAWDHIPALPDLESRMRAVDAVVFGTLAQRDAGSRATIDAVLAAASDRPRVLDLNLRPPFYDRDVIGRSLHHATILKLNEGELDLLPGLIGPEFTGGSPPLTAEALRGLAASYALARIYVTRGGDGCEVFADGELHHRPSPAVAIADTVGAGDAFTAAMVDGELRGIAPPTVAARAAAAGAYVASRPGAMPPWSNELRELMRTVG